MPIVNIQITREGTLPGHMSVTREQKAQLIEGVSKLLLDVLNKPLNSTFVVIDEVDVENWGWGSSSQGIPKANGCLDPCPRYQARGHREGMSTWLVPLPVAAVVPAGAGGAVPER